MRRRCSRRRLVTAGPEDWETLLVRRLRVRVAKCEDSRRLERQAQEMQLLRERALPAHKLTDSPVPLRKVLVVVPIRVNHDNRYYTLLNAMHTGPKESVDIPHVWLEVPETDVLEEGRTMAMALLSEHNYEAVRHLGRKTGN